jgi:putative ABC transport system permease protein
MGMQRWFHGLSYFSRLLFRRRELDQELTDEIEYHIEAKTEENIAKGMTPQEARRAARLGLGGVEQVKEEMRSARTGAWVETLWQDIRFGLRMLRKSPGFTTVAILTLALGIGATTAVFSVTNAVLLRPLNAPNPNRVVMFVDTSRFGSSPLAADIEFNLFRKQTNILEQGSGYRYDTYYLMGVSQPREVNAVLVTEDYFRLFGLPIAEGRSFTPEEELGTGRLFENGHVAVLGNAFWKAAFGGDPRVIGKIISLSGNPYQIVGIMAAGVRADTLIQPDVWLPFPISPSSNNQVHYFEAAGRLKPGITLAMANSQFKLMNKEFRREYPNSISARRGDAYSVEPMQDVMVKHARPSLLALSAAVGLLLLIACANAANLLLARATSRTREIVIRAALGATPARIARQLLAESMLLWSCGGLLGLAFGQAGVRAVLPLIPSTIPRIGANGSNVPLDSSVLLFTLLVTLMTGALFGLIPGLLASRTDPNRNLAESSSRTGTASTQAKARSLLVIAEMSLTLVLLIASALFAHTLIALRTVNPGFDAKDVSTTQTPMDPKLLRSSPEVNDVIKNAVGRLDTLPGVESAALTTVLPLSGDFNNLPVAIVGHGPAVANQASASEVFISPEYFTVLKIPLLRGRSFTDADAAAAQPVAIVNQTMARHLWRNGDPIGGQIIVGKGLGPILEQPARQIVGVVGDVRNNSLGLPPQPTVFMPAAQRRTDRWTGVTASWVVRTRAQSPSVTAAVQKTLRQVTGLPVPSLRSMQDVVDKSTGQQSFNVLLTSIFGCSALLLAAIGIYGVMAYLVAERTREIGVRVALGAQRADVLKMVLAGGGKLALIGIAIGIAVGLGLTKFLSSMLFGVRPWDPLTFALVPVGLLIVALTSCYVPARRAMRIDPMVALRYE